ncbi:MAG: hypothetical protein M1442_00850 [Candidatus Thermoplasmatota archaeon]|jgi:hypothetical protein|nr:hypothetical protein [Candidatus Thermoplasmatota archaeon]
MESGLRKLTEKSSKLKKLVAEKDFTLEMLSEALKEESRNEMNILALEYIGRGVGPTGFASLCGFLDTSSTEHL